MAATQAFEHGSDCQFVARLRAMTIREHASCRERYSHAQFYPRVPDGCWSFPLIPTYDEDRHEQGEEGNCDHHAHIRDRDQVRCRSGSDRLTHLAGDGDVLDSRFARLRSRRRRSRCRGWRCCRCQRGCLYRGQDRSGGGWRCGRRGRLCSGCRQGRRRYSRGWIERVADFDRAIEIPPRPRDADTEGEPAGSLGIGDGDLGIGDVVHPDDDPIAGIDLRVRRVERDQQLAPTVVRDDASGSGQSYLAHSIGCLLLPEGKRGETE